MNTNGAGPGPTPPAERILALDVARGIALFGILVVNMGFFSYPIMYAEYLGIEWWTHPLDVAAQTLIHVLFEAKFISLFSLLFGIGFMLFNERAEQRGHGATLYVRRLVVLLALGLAHLFLIWYGDVLVLYAAVGLVLPFFRRRPAQSVRRWAAACLLFPFIVYVLAAAAATVDVGEDPFQQEFTAQVESQYEASLTVYAQGSWSEVFKVRQGDIAFALEGSILTLPTVLGMFLLGVYLWKRQRLQEQADDRSEWARSTWRRSLALGVVLSALSLYASATSTGAGSPGSLLSHAFTILAGPVLAVWYFTSILLLLERPVWRRRLAVLQSPGRMALSNYISQSLIATSIFYGYGLGWYGRVGPALGILLSVAIFVAQVAWSHWWLARYRYGPLEWLWRYGTYGSRILTRVHQ